MKKYLSLYWSFFKIGILTFGGGYAMLPMLTREVVENHHWATEEELLDYYAIGQCTPGVIAVNTATFVGRKELGFWGAVCTTLGVVTPSFLIISMIAAILLPFMDNPYVMHALAGIRIIVCALILNSVLKMAKKGIAHRYDLLIAAAAFVLAGFTPVPTVLIVILAAAAGIILHLCSGNNKKNGGDAS